MNFEWDHEKSEKNRRERGFPFSYAVGIFEGVTVEVVDDRKDYGEVRVKAIGAIDGRVFVVIFTERAPDLFRIISARRAAAHEVALWQSSAGT